LAPKATTLDEMTQNSHYAVHCHSRSPIFGTNQSSCFTPFPKYHGLLVKVSLSTKKKVPVSRSRRTSKFRSAKSGLKQYGDISFYGKA